MHSATSPFKLFLSLLLLSLVASFAFSDTTFAQSPATISGTLTDPSDAAVGGAAVIAQQLPAAGAASTANTTSDAEGHFRLSLTPGRYRITITHTSLQSYTSEISLAAGETRELKVQLAIEPLSSSVIVSAEARPESTTEASEPVDIVSREEIDERQAIDLAPVLETLPGISLGQGGQPGGPVSVFMDGGNSNYTKVMVDGIPMNDPGGAFDFSNLTLDNIDKVEIVHGAQSALAGSDAMDGTIEIFTHRGSTPTPLFAVEGEGGSFGTGRGSAQLSGQIRNFDYSLDDAYFQTAGDGPNDFFVNRTESGNFGYRFNKTNTLRVTIHGMSSDAGIPGQTLYAPPVLGQVNMLRNISAGATWDFATGSHWQHRITATETDIHEIFQFLPFPNFVNEYNRVDAQAQSSYVTAHFGITFGYWYEVENGVPGDLASNVDRKNMAGFVDGRWQITSRMAVNAGFREDDNVNFGLHADPRVGASYLLRYGHDFWGATRLRFIYGQGIKEPEFDQSYSTNPCAPGNPNLAPEQSGTVNAGIEQALVHNRISVSADFFYNRYHDVISDTEIGSSPECPLSEGGILNFFNADLVHAIGSHVRFQSQITRHVSFAGNYTYDDSRVLVASRPSVCETVGNRQCLAPVNSGSVVLNSGFNRFQFNVLGVFVGQRRDSDFFGLGFTSVPGYTRFDVAGSCRVSSSVTLIARVENLFDARYQNELGYPALGIAAYGGVRLQFGGNRESGPK